MVGSRLGRTRRLPVATVPRRCRPSGSSRAPVEDRSALARTAAACLLSSLLGGRLGGRLLARGRRLAARSRRPLRAPLRQQLARPVDGDLLDAVTLTKARVALTIGDIRPESAFA